MKRLLSTDMMSGLFMLAVGFGGYKAVGGAEIGVINDMGTGYLPRLIAFAIMGGGVVFCALAFLRQPVDVPALFVRPLVLTSLSVAAFALAVDRLGMVIAVIASIAVGSLASAESRWWETVLLAAGIAAGAVLLFIVGLKMPVPIWPR